jgi:hypothetical protein
MLSDYAISSKDLHQLLTELGVQHLHHANTLCTAISFIKAGSLLTRKAVEDDPELFQTPQNSDAKDKKHEVWDSLFLDGTDHHVVFSRRNYYGPVLFKIKLDLLLSDDFGEVYITRSNPQSWPDNMPEERKYYKTIDEVRTNYTAGEKREDARIMFTFRSPGLKLDLEKYLDVIWYDDPKIRVPFKNREVEGRNLLKAALEKAVSKYERPTYKIAQREHTAYCPCHDYYTGLKKIEPQKFVDCFDVSAHLAANEKTRLE